MDKSIHHSQFTIHYSALKWLHRFSVATAISVFGLIVVGAIVTSTGSGLAVPDWPTTFGYNMFLFPFSKMAGGILYEHSHRLIGALVGFMTIILAVWLWVKPVKAYRNMPLLRWLGLFALLAVIVQGVLGGLRVTLLKHDLAIVHAALAQAFFALTICIALFTSRSWLDDNHTNRSKIDIRYSIFDIRILTVFSTILIYLQLVFGAIYRHTGTSLKIHIFLAFLIFLSIFFLFVRVILNLSVKTTLLRPALILIGLLLLQIFLGLSSLISNVAFMITTTAHVVTGALLLATSLVLSLKSYQVFARIQNKQTLPSAIQEAT
jgi:cytochrome c oxidase assembly protein subunit 15